MTALEILSDPEITKKLLETPLPEGFWENQEKLWKEMDEEHKREQESIKMSDEKFNKPFCC